jgi:hypothetical protein
MWDNRVGQLELWDRIVGQDYEPEPAIDVLRDLYAWLYKRPSADRRQERLPPELGQRVRNTLAQSAGENGLG